ncbi:MAG: adenosylcobinamide-GDP ribazoletransferase [Eubacteriales bacterium]|nr:adenosylcobinamide-GDP ribazoletransferase [Eubacteriales bacterium]
MGILRTIGTAFAMYSKIPVPDFKWEEKDMAYQISAFPLVGAAIGLAEYIAFRFLTFAGAGDICRTFVMGAIPLIITGGFHMDGFMDTCDALNSYREREKRLEILKDPHIGSFAVIRAIEWVLLYAAFVSMIREETQAIALGCGFIISRAMSGLFIMKLPNARSAGMLYENTQQYKKGNRYLLIFELIIAFLFMLKVSAVHAFGLVFAAEVSTMYCIRLSKKEFGGVTGDIAGFYLMVNELAIAAAAGIIR